MALSVPYKIRTNGKLLLTGEYFVLDGAQALALPTQKGQLFEVTSLEHADYLHWKSFDNEGLLWFEAKLSLQRFDIIESSDEVVALQLEYILKEAKKQSKRTLEEGKGLLVETRLEFPRKWGLGSSSTLIAAISQWFGVNAFDLLFNSFGGSGYDIACALSDEPLLYQLQNRKPIIYTCNFSPPFKNQLYFVFLGKKQDSRQGIQHYRKIIQKDKNLIGEINDLTATFVTARDLSTFENCINQHEAIVSKAIELTTAKTLHFKDFPGAIKSLGAWGGDFVLATSQLGGTETKKWFKQKGFDTVFSYEEMVFNSSSQ